MERQVIKRRRLKRWVRVTLKIVGGIAAVLVMALLFKVAGSRYNDMYEACDNEKGYTCSYYEARQYSIKGE